MKYYIKEGDSIIYSKEDEEYNFSKDNLEKSNIKNRIDWYLLFGPEYSSDRLEEYKIETLIINDSKYLIKDESSNLNLLISTEDKICYIDKMEVAVDKYVYGIYTGNNILTTVIIIAYSKYITIVDIINENIQYLEIEDCKVNVKIDDIKISFLKEEVETLPRVLRFDSFGNYQFKTDEYGIYEVNELIHNTNISLSKKVVSVIKMIDHLDERIIKNICYLPALFTEDGLIYIDEKTGFIEQTEITVVDKIITSVTQSYEECSKEEFLSFMNKNI